MTGYLRGRLKLRKPLNRATISSVTKLVCEQQGMKHSKIKHLMKSQITLNSKCIFFLQWYVRHPSPLLRFLVVRERGKLGWVIPGVVLIMGLIHIVTRTTGYEPFVCY